MVLNVKSVMVLTKSNTIEMWLDVAKLTIKLTLLDLKPKKKSYVLTHSNMLTVKANIKLIAMTVHSRNISSTNNSTKRKSKSSEKLKLT